MAGDATSDSSVELDPLLGTVIDGRYLVVELLGQGGMAKVFEVEHTLTEQRYALKLLAPKKGDAEGLAERFIREAKAASILDHPHIVEMLDMRQLPDGTPFLVMELARGTPLGTLMDHRAIGPRRALVITRQVLEALGYAHAQGLVHRDLKPDNIMLMTVGEPGRQYDDVKLLDFGLVKLTGRAERDLGGGKKLTNTGIVFGTPDYMAPEQALGKDVDGRADLYAMGVMLFEMLTGRHPFGAPTPVEMMHMQVSTPPPPLCAMAPTGAEYTTPQMEALMRRALAKQPEQRYRDAAAMIEALDAAFASLADLPPEQ